MGEQSQFAKRSILHHVSARTWVNQRSFATGTTGMARRHVRMVGLVVAVMAVWITGCEREVLDEEAISVAAEASEGAPAAPVGSSEHYTMRVEGAEVAAAEPAQLELQLLPGPDLKINLEFPWTIEFEEQEGLELPAGVLDASAMELTDEVARIPMDVTVTEAGTREVTARANFSVCNDDRCEILRDQKLQFSVHAE
jgi:hypothetical protein